MTNDNLILTALGFATGALFGEALLKKCRTTIPEKFEEEKAETIALTVLHGLCIAIDSSYPSIAPLIQGTSFGLTITALSVAKNSSNLYNIFTNLATIGAVFKYHSNNNQAPQAIFPVILVLGLISSIRQRNIDNLLEENDELFEEVNMLVEEAEENAEDAAAKAKDQEELAQLKAYKPFIEHHITTGHASPRQLKHARDRYEAILAYTNNPSQTPRRSLSRTRTCKMVANNNIFKISK